ncbi:MAG: type I polyketide synthase, partial [Gammaproteobacteria bacterium]
DYYSIDPEAEDKTPVKHGGFIEDIEYFDAAFFGISRREAEMMDPQQRLLLEITWHALENAGINPKELNESDAGVFIGATTLEYEDLLVQAHVHNSYIATGNTLNVLSGRLSYCLGLHGPCLTLDTACSSSLTALHIASNSLHLGETSLAIVGGVNVLLSPDTFIDLSKANMLSLDGHCKVFDNKADGYVRSEGCGVVILKRLSDAVKDNDRILAVIKSSVMNQDGASSGLTVPNGVAQEKLLRAALSHAQLEPRHISYLEAHGTGTELGDPMELHALSMVYQKSHDEQKPLIIGSVKANIGHLESAAGMAGLIKVILSLQHEAIPAQINLQSINSKINLTHIPAHIPLELTPWKKQAEPRRAGISSFGFSGINAHIILEEAPVSLQMRHPLPKTVFHREFFWAKALGERQLKLYEWKNTLPIVAERDLSTPELVWVILADKNGLSESLGGLLLDRGAKILIYPANTSWEDIQAEIFQQQPLAGLIYFCKGENDIPYPSLAKIDAPLWIVFSQTDVIEDGIMDAQSLGLQGLAREAFFAANAHASLIGIPQEVSAKRQIAKALYLELCQK